MNNSTAARTAEKSAGKPAPRKRGPKVDVGLTRQRQTDIVREAAQLFDKVGYHGVNMEMIAEAAGLKKPTLYHYIAGKEEILYRMQAEMVGSLRDRMAVRRAEGADPVSILRGIYEDIFRQMHESPGAVRSFFEHRRDLGPKLEQVIRKERNAYTADVIHVIGEGMDQGVLRRADARLTTLCFFGVVNWAYQWYRADRAPSPEKVANDCFDIFARGMLMPKA